VTPTAINFGLTRLSKTIIAENGGGGTLSNVSATDDASWLTVTGSGLGAYTVAVDDTALSPGVYSATITFNGIADSVAVSVNVPVTLQVGGAGSGDAGLQYVLLIDSGGQTVYQTTTTASESYRFTIGGVKAGSYFVLAGSDLDNDLYICTPGEACGAYPTLDLPAALNVSGVNITGIDFTAGYTSSLGTQAASLMRARGYARLPAKQPAP